VAAAAAEPASPPPAREWPSDTPKGNAGGVDSSTATPASSSGNGNGSGTNGKGNGAASTRAMLSNLGIGRGQVTFAAQADAPSCAECGSIMVRNGSCYKCLNCGSTSGCS
jgi:ribonucleoside-diphosphate reductase alpha chain